LTYIVQKDPASKKKNKTNDGGEEEIMLASYPDGFSAHICR
jgi:hypothetical protein